MTANVSDNCVSEILYDNKEILPSQISSVDHVDSIGNVNESSDRTAYIQININAHNAIANSLDRTRVECC